MPNFDFDALKAQIGAQIAQVDSAEKLEDFRLKYLGRKGLLAELTASIPGLPREERANFGQQVNTLKNQLNALIQGKEKNLGVAKVIPVTQRKIDITLPGIVQEVGRLHPITQIIDEICGVFTQMGFSVVDGPEIETEYNNFTGLNIPLEHPSREAFDTFYLKSSVVSRQSSADSGKLLLRSHTSPVQIRVMKERKPPLAVVVPGRVFRPDAVDASHLFMFHQIEGFLVDKNIKFSDLKGVLEVFLKAVFGKDIKMRLRPHFFPFTEPSAEVDISCIICGQEGCSVCGRKGWLEILGCGMIHSNVFKNVGYNPKIYTGFAFGMGVERIAMLKYGIDDIRLFFQNDLRFLEQF